METVNELNNRQQQQFEEEDEMVDMDGLAAMDEDEDDMEGMQQLHDGYQLPNDQMDDDESSPG